MDDIILHILPIFDKYPLLTSKHYKYTLFRESILIYKNNNIPINKKMELITNNYYLYKLKLSSIIHTNEVDNTKNSNINYISPIWKIINNNVNNIEEANKVLTKSWIIGFIEAEGSFYLVHKDKNRLTHAFEITQKQDYIVMKSLSLILNLNLQLNKNYITIVSTNKNTIENLTYYFFKCFKGIKSLEYRIWARSFHKQIN